MSFQALAAHSNPGRDELLHFVAEVRNLLYRILEDRQHFGFLWEGAASLHELAWQTYRHDIVDGAGLELDIAIADIPEYVLRQHGLSGRPLSFKFGVVATIDARWARIGAHFSIREWLARLLAAIDAILDSLVAACGGKGGLVKEFKDALAALI